MTNKAVSKWPDYSAAKKQWDTACKSLPQGMTESVSDGYLIPSFDYTAKDGCFWATINMTSDADFKAAIYWRLGSPYWDSSNDSVKYFNKVADAIKYVIETERIETDNKQLIKEMQRSSK